MNRISISQAWSYATSFFNGQMANHAIVLIGIGIVVPLVLQFTLGGSAQLLDPTTLASGGEAGMIAAFGATAFLVGIVNFILQTGSYFASWRIGLTSGGEPLGSAIGYGLIAALPVLLLTIAVVLVFGIIGFIIAGSAMMTMASGQGNPGDLAAMGVGVLIFLPLFLLFLVWLAARFCCTGPVMADRRSYNVLSGLGESWRMTAASQWKLVAYFILIVVALMVIGLILSMIVGVSVFATGSVPSSGSLLALILASALMGIPMAYLQVGVPAGIYRALGRSDASEVFA